MRACAHARMRASTHQRTVKGLLRGWAPARALRRSLRAPRGAGPWRAPPQRGCRVGALGTPPQPRGRWGRATAVRLRRRRRRFGAAAPTPRCRRSSARAPPPSSWRRRRRCRRCEPPQPSAAPPAQRRCPPAARGPAQPWRRQQPRRLHPSPARCEPPSKRATSRTPRPEQRFSRPASLRSRRAPLRRAPRRWWPQPRGGGAAAPPSWRAKQPRRAARVLTLRSQQPALHPPDLPHHRLLQHRRPPWHLRHPAKRRTRRRRRAHAAQSAGHFAPRPHLPTAPRAAPPALRRLARPARVRPPLLPRQHALRRTGPGAGGTTRRAAVRARGRRRRPAPPRSRAARRARRRRRGRTAAPPRGSPAAWLYRGRAHLQRGQPPALTCTAPPRALQHNIGESARCHTNSIISIEQTHRSGRRGKRALQRL